MRKWIQKVLWRPLVRSPWVGQIVWTIMGLVLVGLVLLLICRSYPATPGIYNILFVYVGASLAFFFSMWASLFQSRRKNRQNEALVLDLLLGLHHEMLQNVRATASMDAHLYVRMLPAFSTVTSLKKDGFPRLIQLGTIKEALSLINDTYYLLATLDSELRFAMENVYGKPNLPPGRLDAEVSRLYCRVHRIVPFLAKSVNALSALIERESTFEYSFERLNNDCLLKFWKKANQLSTVVETAQKQNIDLSKRPKHELEEDGEKGDGVVTPSTHGG